ncbi:GntR family transcriptional regulator [Pseudochelatococcus sp. B33]
MRDILANFSNQGTTANAVYSALRYCIIEGQLQPGERLLSDDLAGRLGVSRTPVREALRKLEAEGYVTTAWGKGLVVRELSEKELEEVFFIREVLEAAAARLAAENITSTQLIRLEELLEDMDIANKHGHMELFRKLTGEFHALIHQASRNDKLALLLRNLLDSVRQFSSSTLFAGRATEALAEYHALYEAIKARDGGKAEQLARDHRRKTLAMRRQMLRSKAMDEATAGKPHTRRKPQRNTKR